jgi:hypothetical protein
MTGPDTTQTRSRRSRLRSTAVPAGPADLGVLARQAVVSFLRDASDATADRAAARSGPPTTGIGATPPRTTAGGRVPQARTSPVESLTPAGAGRDAGRQAAESAAWQAAATGIATLERIEAAAAKIEADIAVALRAQAELHAGAGAAAEAAVRAALEAWESAAAAAESDRQAKISLRKVGRYVSITFIFLVITLIMMLITASPVH